MQYRIWGIAFALAGTVSFAFRPVLIKLAYAAHPVSATTLLFLRMTLSLPFFLADGMVDARRAAASRAATGSASSASASSAITWRACSTSSACSTCPPASGG